MRSAQTASPSDTFIHNIIINYQSPISIKYAISDRRFYRLSQFSSGGRATHIPSQITTFTQYVFNGLHDAVVRCLIANMLQQHGTGPDRPDRVGNVLIRDVRCGTMHRFKHGWIGLHRIDIGRRGNRNGTGTSRSQVREDIAKRVTAERSTRPSRRRNAAGAPPRRPSIPRRMDSMPKAAISGTVATPKVLKRPASFSSRRSKSILVFSKHGSGWRTATPCPPYTDSSTPT